MTLVPPMPQPGTALARTERVCTDPSCDHNGHGVGRYEEPCSWCGYHDCDLDCSDPDEDE